MIKPKQLISKWDRRFLTMAAGLAGFSKDPSTKVGAVLVHPDNTVISVGYNGFPRGVDDNPERYENRELKYALIVHAEMNAILKARCIIPEGSRLYVTPLYPCSQCAAAIVQSGIKEVIAEVDQSRDDWKARWEIASLIFNEAGVKVRSIERE